MIKPVLAARFFRNKKELMERMEEILEKPKTGKSMGIWFMLVITILFLGNIKVSAMERQFRTSPSEDRSEEIKGVGMRVERFEEGTAVYFEEGDLP